jgi:hypothetical protein
MTYRPTIAWDFDGVLHSYERGWQDGTVYGTLDFSLIEEGWRRGYANAIITTRDVLQVANCLPSEWTIHTDIKSEAQFWDGGEDGKAVLVTNRKVAAIAYVDDRAIHYRFDEGYPRREEVFSLINQLGSKA